MKDESVVIILNNFKVILTYVMCFLFNTGKQFVYLWKDGE